MIFTIYLIGLFAFFLIDAKAFNFKDPPWISLLMAILWPLSALLFIYNFISELKNKKR